MEYYTQRNGLRKAITKTYLIDDNMYGVLFDCCTRYKKYLAWKYPVDCADGRGIYSIDDDMLRRDLTYEVPGLYRDECDNIAVPKNDAYGFLAEYDRYSILDFIEFVSANCKDISNVYYHKYFGHEDLTFADTNDIRAEFESEINNLFVKIGLLYQFNEQHQIIRIEEHGVLNDKIERNVDLIQEDGLKKLLQEAINFHYDKNPESWSLAVEKLWDALERLKTYYSSDKKQSSQQLIETMANGQTEFVSLFEDEFKYLTSIGNKFRIRHHENGVVDIKDIKHYDYFFNRCLSLVSLAIKYLIK